MCDVTVPKVRPHYLYVVVARKVYKRDKMGISSRSCKEFYRTDAMQTRRHQYGEKRQHTYRSCEFRSRWGSREIPHRTDRTHICTMKVAKETSVKRYCQIQYTRSWHTKVNNTAQQPQNDTIGIKVYCCVSVCYSTCKGPTHFVISHQSCTRNDSLSNHSVPSRATMNQMDLTTAYSYHYCSIVSRRIQPGAAKCDGQNEKKRLMPARVSWRRSEMRCNVRNGKISSFAQEIRDAVVFRNDFK